MTEGMAGGLVGIPNRNTRLRARLLGSRIRYPVHWIPGKGPSIACCGPRCRYCPDMRSYWFALAAQQEERQTVESAPSAQTWPEGFLRWPSAQQREWLKANPPPPREAVEELKQSRFTLALYEDWYLELMNKLGDDDLRGVEVLVTRAAYNAAVRVTLVGRSLLALLDDFSPLTALVKRYGDGIADGIAAVLPDAIASPVIDPIPFTKQAKKKRA